MTPTSDLVKRLRAQICCARSEECQGRCNGGPTLTQVFLQRDEAADRLEQLERENAELREYKWMYEDLCK